MRRFDLLEPRSLEQACDLLEQHPEARLIAGGTSLLVLIKQGVYRPALLINLKKVRNASAITYDPVHGLRIGALATIREVEASPLVRQFYPVLATACHTVANVRIRNLATIGGSLAHADYQSDPPAVLVGLEARVELTSVRGRRELPVEEFLLGSYETAIEPGEVLSAVLVPVLPPDLSGTYLKFTTRSSEDRPCAGVTALVRGQSGRCEEARLVIGAVSPVPVRIRAAEKLAVHRPLTPDLIEAMATEAASAVDPIEDLRGSAEYKRHITRVLARRALTSINEGAGL